MLLKKRMPKQSFKALILMAPFVLAGCSSIPDAANPVEWYRSSVEYFTSDEPEVKTSVEEGEETDPQTAQADVEESQIPTGFNAPAEASRQYAQPVARQGEVVNALGSTATASNQPPVPAAAPVQSVQSVAVPAPQQAGSIPEQPINTVVASTPSQGIDQTVSQRLDPSATGRDNRSIGEIFASNISQQRPTDTGTLLRSPDSITIGGHSFDTVVVSGSGVSRQQPTMPQFQQQPQQFASLSTTVQSDFRPITGMMAVEPRLVREGRAISLNSHNPSQFSGSFQVATIQFGNGSSQLTGEDQRILREVLSIHQEQGGVIRVVGHASSRTRDMTPEQHRQVNLNVSLSRADIVGAELLRLGVNSQRLFVGGVSDTLPLYQEVMPSGEAGNRRTEIFIDY